METKSFCYFTLSWFTSNTRLIKNVVIFAIVIFCSFRFYNENVLTTKLTREAKIQEIVNEGGKTDNPRMLREEKSLKLVLFYTPLFGKTPWPMLENDLQFTRSDNIPCEAQGCRISYNKADLNKSDAVLFHGQDIDGINLSHLSGTCSTRAKQRWVFFIHENPIYFTHDLSLFDNVFNWTMTYKLSSDIFVPYTYYFPRESSSAELNHGSENYALGKDMLVAWVVSHCGRQRDKLVKKLMEYIPVHVYGTCSFKFSQNRKCVGRGKKTSCWKNLRRYKFYLAFENANCVDYITEKYWRNSLQNTIVPVVLGGGNYSDKNLAVPGSFVNVMDFSSVKELADHLVMLDNNDTAYNEYFAWRKLYQVGFPPSWTCALCSMLNNATIPAKTYNRESFAKFWSPETNCAPRDHDERVERIINASPNRTLN